MRLDVRHLTVRDDAGREALSDVSLTIHAGEVLGIAGVEGNGQTELVEAVIGMHRPATGTVVLGEEDITHWSILRRREAGIGYIPEDRHRHGLLLDAPLWENRMLGHQTREPNIAGPFLDRRGAREDSDRVKHALEQLLRGLVVEDRQRA